MNVGTDRRRGSATTLDRAGLDRLLASAGLLIGLGYAAFNVTPYDTTLFWSAAQQPHYYGQTWAADASSLYVYPPPMAQVLGAVPWVPYLFVWTTVLGLAFWAATRSWSLIIVAISTVGLIVLGPDHLLANPVDLTMIGNPQIILAAVCLLGFRFPALWSLALLTKISPGIGVLWFAVRREWRSLGIALGATALIAGVSLVLAPGAWVDFLRFATANVGTPSPNPVVPVPFLVRLPMSVLLIAWGALTDRRWTVPDRRRLGLARPVRVDLHHGLDRRAAAARARWRPHRGVRPVAAWSASDTGRPGLGSPADPGLRPGVALET